MDLSQKANVSLTERAQSAAVAPYPQLAPYFKETAPAVLIGLARNPHLKERDLLRLLERKDLPAKAVEAVAAHPITEQSYAVRIALARHPRAPRSVSLPTLKQLYLFDLVGVALAPTVPADVKRAAEELVLKRMEGLPRGEKITLARRGPGRVAAALALTTDRTLIAAALDNPYLTEAHLIKVLGLQQVPSTTVKALAQHRKWSLRYNLRLAMVRHPLTPFHAVLTWLPNLAVSDLRQISQDPAMPEPVRRYVQAHCQARTEPPVAGSVRLRGPDSSSHLH